MKAKIIRNAAVVAAIIFFFHQAAYAASWQSNLKSALGEAKDLQKPLMVDFYTDWCGWCKKLDSDTYSDSKVAGLCKKFICVKVDADKNQDLAQKYEVSGYPTIIFLDYEGNVDKKIAGYLGPADFANAMEDVLKKTKKPKPKVKEAKKQPGYIAGEPQQNKGEGGFVLNGIMLDSNNIPEAIINDVVVKVGDTIENAKVLEITKDGVKLSSKGKEITLRLK